MTALYVCNHCLNTTQRTYTHLIHSFTHSLTHSLTLRRTPLVGEHPCAGDALVAAVVGVAETPDANARVARDQPLQVGGHGETDLPCSARGWAVGVGYLRLQERLSLTPCWHGLTELRYSAHYTRHQGVVRLWRTVGRIRQQFSGMR